MVATIYSFTRALHAPAECFTTLRDAVAIQGRQASPEIVRTARFAEAVIEWRKAQWLLCMPLTSAAVPDMERMAAYLKTLHSEWLADYRLLREEMHYTDSTGTERRCDLVLQYLPAGCTFAEALTNESAQQLLAALDALEEELRRLDISHRNLKSENLRWSGGRWIPIRYHYARRGAGGDAEAFNTLRREVLRGTEPQQTAHDIETPYENPCDRLTGHRWVGNVFEQLVCVEDTTGYGYVDTSNRVVIPAQYIWADDFHEGRAAVETERGMGLIDKTGRYIIEPRYEIVEYNYETGLSQVRLDGRWATFGYEGQAHTEFEQKEIFVEQKRSE